ncbi:hypothetical protein GK047_00140 [Paenibacillus sp. SYP-B3998]|uniref:Uncharacterized protein n=1 Tax=Paenibacillus sp. SYP-B3998 TaxID=2678564 RepID=A0A6G3ZQF5_9BACL|nr:hypothetical protein [Paenibacillus sp. SYP-B3998]NEW04433.1 hypothetical protein [Paenibacillus sp. SYP-B3998]
MTLTTRDSIELHMLTSLARSQRALCRMLESVADQVEASQQLAQHLSENMEMISNYQRALIQKITKLTPRKRSTGKPADPWINKLVAVRQIGKASGKR